MMALATLIGLALLLPAAARAAGEPVSYYLPQGGPYRDDVPTPAEFFGHEVGAWHLRPAQITGYLEALAAAAPERARVEVFGRSHEGRPLLQLVVASSDRIQDLDAVRRRHLNRPAPGDRPVVVNLGYSIHGNESSGANAAVLVAYWLVAGEDETARRVRDQAVVLLDPVFNPDGLARFAHWANTHRGRRAVADRFHREHREPWPSGRTNHYWFDLNRDWFPLVHPESRARIARFHAWKPNVMNDHHEMGTHRTFFFQPGVPSRNNPTTPDGVFALQEQLAEFHATALDRVGSFYYSAEGFDDFYVGKGSVYPDLNGGVGILYEQASSRGLVQETDFGDLTFEFGIRNQVLTSLSTLEGAVALRDPLLRHQRAFYAGAEDFARERDIGGWVFDPGADRARAWELLDLLQRHNIAVHRLRRDVELPVGSWAAGSWMVPAAQPQARLLAELFSDRIEFEDTVFYDISAWSVPLAFNLRHAAVDWDTFTARGGLLGDPVTVGPRPVGRMVGEREQPLAYVIRPESLDLPRALGRLGRAGVVTQLVTQPFSAVPAGDETAVEVPAGSIMVPVTRQPSAQSIIEATVDDILREDAVTVMALDAGLTPAGPDLGSPSLVTLPAGRVAILVGRGVDTYDAGAVWHTLDQRWDLAPVLLELADVSAADLGRYDAIVMVDGRYGGLGEAGVMRLRDWTRGGGTLVAFGSAMNWAAEKLEARLGFVEVMNAEKAGVPATERRPFREGERYERAKLVPGTIFWTDVDLSHPLAYGLGQERLPVFRYGQQLLQHSSSPYQTPLVYAEQPLAAGYLPPGETDRVAQQAAAVVAPLGEGRVVALTDNPAFRGYWLGSMRLLSNAIFFGPAMETP